MLTLGIDSSTQGTKALLLDTQTGEVVALAQEPYGVIEGLPPGHWEQHPAWWVEATGRAVRRVLEAAGPRRGEVAAIGVSAQQHGCVVLDAKDEPVRPAKLWCDTSTTTQCAAFDAAFGGPEGLIALAGNPMLPGYTAPKLLWIKENEPEHFRQIRSVLLPHDYLNFWLTGEMTMEYGDASGTGLLDIRSRAWRRELVEFIDPALSEWLPTPGSSLRPAGFLRDALRREWGLSGNPVVSAGAGDNMAAAIGTGNTLPGRTTVSLGTSGTLFSCSQTPVIDSGGEIAAFCDSADGWLPLICTMNVSSALAQTAALFGWKLPELDAAIETVPPGADGLLFLPYLNGERTPSLPEASAVLHGLRPGNMTPAHLARAAMEGVTLGLAYGLERFREAGLEPREIRLTGGGSRSGTWRRICANVFGLPVVSLPCLEGAALGAAIQAAAAVQGFGSIKETAERFVVPQEGSRVEPDLQARALYADRLQQQTALAQTLHAAGYL